MFLPTIFQFGWSWQWLKFYSAVTCSSHQYCLGLLCDLYLPAYLGTNYDCGGTNPRPLNLVVVLVLMITVACSLVERFGEDTDTDQERLSSLWKYHALVLARYMIIMKGCFEFEFERMNLNLSSNSNTAQWLAYMCSPGILYLCIYFVLNVYFGVCVGRCDGWWVSRSNGFVKLCSAHSPLVLWSSVWQQHTLLSAILTQNFVTRAMNAFLIFLTVAGEYCSRAHRWIN